MPLLRVQIAPVGMVANRLIGDLARTGSFKSSAIRSGATGAAAAGAIGKGAKQSRLLLLVLDQLVERGDNPVFHAANFLAGVSVIEPPFDISHPPVDVVERFLFEGCEVGLHERAVWA